MLACGTEIERRRATFTILRVLRGWSDFDDATLWWVTGTAALLARAEGRPAFGEALDLLAAMRPARPGSAGAPCRRLDRPARLN
jgi:hypothetical protein